MDAHDYLTPSSAELKAFHENMEKQMTDKLASIESARAELIAATIEAEVCFIFMPSWTNTDPPSLGFKSTEAKALRNGIR